MFCIQQYKKELPDEALEDAAGRSLIGTAFNATKAVVSLGISIVGFLKEALKQTSQLEILIFPADAFLSQGFINRK